MLFQRLRMLTARMLAPAQWWTDMQRGKSRLKGVEVARTVRKFGGRTMLVQLMTSLLFGYSCTAANGRSHYQNARPRPAPCPAS